LAVAKKTPRPINVTPDTRIIPAIEKILTHLGLDPQPPPRGKAREAVHEFAA